MAHRRPHGAYTTETSSTAGWVPSRRSCLRVALLLLSTGALTAAATVAAAQMPGSQAAYGPPPPPDSVQIAPVDPKPEVAPASQVALADSARVDDVSSVRAAIGVAFVASNQPESAVQQPSGESPALGTPMSSVVEGPLVIASSWSMSPLPEGDDGSVTSSTSMDPVTQSSATTASPQ